MSRPEPVPEKTDVTLFDLVQNIRKAMDKAHTLADQQCSSIPDHA